MNWYVDFVTSNPIVSAMVQFAILGTFGDVISKWIIKGKVFSPFPIPIILFKMIGWAILAICIKYAFIGFHGFVEFLILHKLLPELNLLAKSIAISVSINLQFGPFLVIVHRLSDNLIHKENNWQNLNKGFLSLLWFWIPAHTVTFMLDKPFQIGLAAVWSLVLGIILGFYNKRN